jgi:hypothetical protein
MATQNELQTLLRFLSTDAKIPLPVAMSKVKDLRTAGLTKYVISRPVMDRTYMTLFDDVL